MNDVARDIQDPETKLSLWKRAQLGRDQGCRAPRTDRREARSRGDFAAGHAGRWLGSTRHSIIFAGVAALGIGFGGEDGGGIYHSIYDDFTGTHISVIRIFHTERHFRRPAERR